MMVHLATLIRRITYPVIEAVGSRTRGSKHYFPWTFKQWILGPGVRTIVRQPGTRVFFQWVIKRNDFGLMVWTWREGWVSVGVLFAKWNEEGDIHISDVHVKYQSQGYGTLLVQTCLNVATTMGASHVEGFLSPFDDVPQLAIFYSRIGFDVTLTATGDSGHIIKKLG